MPKKAQYEQRILNEIRALPEEALPKVVRMISLIRDEYISGNEIPPSSYNDRINHQRTRSLLSNSKSNWAHDIIVEREDRI